MKECVIMGCLFINSPHSHMVRLFLKGCSPAEPFSALSDSSNIQCIHFIDNGYEANFIVSVYSVPRLTTAKILPSNLFLIMLMVLILSLPSLIRRL